MGRIDPLPERTDYYQRFACIDASGKQVGYATIPMRIGVRFVEYLVIAYVLIGVGTLVRWLRHERRPTFER